MIKTKLNDTERLLSTVFKVSRQGICITDSNGMFVNFNDAYLKIYGYKRNDLVGKPFTIVVPDAMKKKAERLHQQFIKDGVEPPAEWTVVRKDGKQVKIGVEATLLVNDVGERFKVTSIHLLEK